MWFEMLLNLDGLDGHPHRAKNVLFAIGEVILFRTITLSMN